MEIRLQEVLGENEELKKQLADTESRLSEVQEQLEDMQRQYAGANSYIETLRAQLDAKRPATVNAAVQADSIAGQQSWLWLIYIEILLSVFHPIAFLASCPSSKTKVGHKNILKNWYKIILNKTSIASVFFLLWWCDLFIAEVKPENIPAIDHKDNPQVLQDHTNAVAVEQTHPGTKQEVAQHPTPDNESSTVSAYWNTG
jgi:hypothetical protein